MEAREVSMVSFMIIPRHNGFYRDRNRIEVKGPYTINRLFEDPGEFIMDFYYTGEKIRDYLIWFQ